MSWGKWAKALRINRGVMRDRIRNFHEELERVETRDLRSEARDKERARVRRELRDAYLELRRKSENCIREAVHALRQGSPGALRRKAAFKDPARVTDVVRLLEGVNDAELLWYAELAVAESDAAAGEAIRRAMSGREKLDRDLAGQLSRVLRQLDGNDDGLLVSDVVVARRELAGLSMDFAIAFGTEAALLEASGLDHEAGAVEVDGEVRKFDDRTLTKAYEAVGVERTIEAGEYPDPVPGTLVHHEPEPAA